MKTLVRLVEIQEAMGHLDVAFSEMNYKVEGIDDKVLDIFGKKYPWKDSFEDVVIDVKNWINNFEKLTKIYEDKLVKEKEKEYITINFIDIIKLLYDEDYEFKMEYNCPQYDIRLDGDNDNVLSLCNSPTDNGEECIMYVNKDEVFRSQDTEIMKNQIMIIAKLIGAK